MFFFLSKILFFLISPSLWVTVQLMIAFIKRRKNYAKRLFIIAVVLFFVFSNQFLFKKACLGWQINESNIQPNTKYTAIYLGGAVHFDKNLKGNFIWHADRFIETLSLFNQGKISAIILSAGNGSLERANLNEAEFVKQELIKNKVPDSIIITESRSRNTYENAVYTKRIIDSLHIKTPLVLITSAIHMRRSTACFKKQGMNISVYPTSFHVREDDLEWNDLVPQAWVMSGWSDLIKEMIGLFTYKVTGKA